MLIVAPSGSVNDVIRLLTRPRSSTVLSVTGSVMLDDDVLNAVMSAGDIARNHFTGLIPPRTLRTIGSVTQAWMMSAAATVTMYSSSALKGAKPVLATTLTMSAKTP